MKAGAVAASAAQGVLLIAAFAWAGEGDDVARKSLETMRKHQAIAQQQNDANESRQKRMIQLLQENLALEKGPMTEEQIENNKRFLAIYRERLTQAQTELELGQIRDPGQRARRLVELEAQLKPLKEELEKKRRPLTEKRLELMMANNTVTRDFDELIRSRLKEPSGKFSDLKAEMLPTIGVLPGGALAQWKDAAGNIVASAEFCLRDRPAVPADGRKLDERHWVQDSDLTGLRFWAGHFQIRFTVWKDQWQEPQAIIETLKALIDYDALAAEDAADPRTTVAKALATYKMGQVLGQEEAKLGDEIARVKVMEAGWAALKAGPLTEEQADRRKSDLEMQQQSIARVETSLAIGIVADPQKRADMLKANKADLEKLEREMNSISKSAFEAAAAFETANAAVSDAHVALIRKFARSPGGQFAGLKPSARGSAGRGQVVLDWNDVTGTPAVSATFHLHEKSAAPADPDKLARKYALAGIADQAVAAPAGPYYDIVFSVSKKEWHGADPRQIMKEFLDVDGLAAINAGGP